MDEQPSVIDELKQLIASDQEKIEVWQEYIAVNQQRLQEQQNTNLLLSLVFEIVRDATDEWSQRYELLTDLLTVAAASSDRQATLDIIRDASGDRERRHVENMIESLTRQKAILEETRAKMGLDAPPRVVMQIEDTTEQIARYRAQLRELGDASDN